MPNSMRLLFDFADPAARPGWRSVDDVVMGGVSDSDLVAVDAETVAFAGHVSLEHGGGFASIRSPRQAWNLSAFDGIQFHARGDGQRYKLTLYTDDADGISYRFPFTATPDWSTYFAPFEALRPMRRGRHVPDAPAFDPGAVTTLGFLIGDKQAGPFRLELGWIRAAAQP